MFCENMSYIDPTIDPTMEGTTIVAFYFEGGIMVGVESRSSNDVDLERPPRWEPKIQDNAIKYFKISPNIIAMLSGTVSDCNNLRKHVEDESSNMGKAPKISDALRIVSEYLHRCRGQEKKFGTLIAGYDKGFQIHSVYIQDNNIEEKKLIKVIDKFTSLGTGRDHADAIMNKGYKYKLSAEAALELARRALFRATFFDKRSGGILHVFHILKETCLKLQEFDVLDAYARYYNDYDERKTLFLIVSSKYRNFCADHLIARFKIYGDKAEAAHRVSQRKSGSKSFYFHRLVFDSKAKAANVYNSVKKNGHSHNEPAPSFLKEHFPHRVFFDEVPIYVAKSSKNLLRVIIESSEKYSPKQLN